MIAEEGIEITANDVNKSLSIKNKCFLTDAQLETIRNGLSGSDKFMTESQIRALIAQLSGGGGGNTGDNTPPEGFPKFFITSANFTIPKTGRYKVSMVGGGGGGGAEMKGENGGDSCIEYNSIKRIGTGGSGGGSGGYPITENGGIPAVLFNMQNEIGGTKGGMGGKPGDNGYGQGGKGGNATNFGGGGGGSPLNYNILDISAKNAENSSDGYGGKGYGAGGGGGTNNHGSALGGGGGSSGCLNTFIGNMNTGSKLKVIVGSGGKGSYNTKNRSAGDGAQGAVLIEWLGAN